MTVVWWLAYVMIVIIGWMFLIDYFVMGPIDRRFKTHKRMFDRAFIQGDEQQMVNALTSMEAEYLKLCNAMLIGGHPTMLYHWMRGSYPPPLFDPTRS